MPFMNVRCLGFRVLCLITDRCRYSGDASMTRDEEAHFINKKKDIVI